MPHYLRNRRLLQDNQPPEIIDGYLLNDTFTTARAAGAVNDTYAEPGPGRRTVTDGNGKLSLSGGRAVFATGGVSAGDPGIVYGAVGREPGRIVTVSGSWSAGGMTSGFDTDIGGLVANGIRSSSTTLACITNGVAVTVATAALNTTYQEAVVARSAGMFYFIKGGTFVDWTLIWVGEAGSGNLLYPTMTLLGSTSAATGDYLRVPAALWLPSPLLSDGFSVWGTTDGAGHAEGVAGGLGSGGGGLWPYVEEGLWQASGGVASAAALTGGGVALAYMDVGTLDLIATVKVTRVGGVAGLVVRGDAVNHVRAVHNGTNAQLIKRVSGVDTILINAAATYVAGAEIRVIADGQKFRLFYNNLAIGSEQTIADAVLSTDGYAGIYTTDTGNTFDEFVVYARGSGGEYAALDAF